MRQTRDAVLIGAGRRASSGYRTGEVLEAVDEAVISPNTVCSGTPSSKAPSASGSPAEPAPNRPPSRTTPRSATKKASAPAARPIASGSAPPWVKPSLASSRDAGDQRTSPETEDDADPPLVPSQRNSQDGTDD